MDSCLVQGATGLAVGAAYGACFTTPIGVAGCAIYGATMFASSSVICNVLNAAVSNQLQGTIKTISFIAVAVFSVYSSFFAANAVSTFFGYSVNVIPTVSLAVSTLIKGTLAPALLIIAAGVSAVVLFMIGVLALGMISEYVNRDHI
jgi:hypothetical protein